MATTMTVVHHRECKALTGTRTEVRASSVDRLALPHSVCLPGGIAPAMVVVTETEVGEHPYRPSMIWPAGEPESRCFVCRGTKQSH